MRETSVTLGPQELRPVRSQVEASGAPVAGHHVGNLLLTQWGSRGKAESPQACRHPTRPTSPSRSTKVDSSILIRRRTFLVLGHLGRGQPSGNQREPSGTSGTPASAKLCEAVRSCAKLCEAVRSQWGTSGDPQRRRSPLRCAIDIVQPVDTLWATWTLHGSSACVASTLAGLCRCSTPRQPPHRPC